MESNCLIQSLFASSRLLRLSEIEKEHREKHYHHVSSGVSNGDPDKSEGKATSEKERQEKLESK